MALDYGQLMSLKREGERFRYSERETMLYALGIGMGGDPLNREELAYVFEQSGLKTVPSMATVLTRIALLKDCGFDYTKVLHGEQRLTLHRPLPAEGELIASARVTEAYDKGPGRGAVIYTETAARSAADGRPMYTLLSVTFARGDGGFGGPPGAGPQPHALPGRRPDATVTLETRKDQALLYRLNGDRNPLHADPDLARRAGLSRRIDRDRPVGRRRDRVLPLPGSGAGRCRGHQQWPVQVDALKARDERLILIKRVPARRAENACSRRKGVVMLKQTILSMALALLAGAGGALAQYPVKPVTMVVPYAAGGPTDTVARVMGVAMTKPLGQTVIVENKPSAGGILGPEQVKNAKPDGYTILIHHIGMATTPALYRQLRFNPLTDFEYIGLINDVPMTLIARQNFPAKDFKEFLAYIKANKEKVTYANAGIGAASHLCGMLFMSAIQTDLLTVPYKGTAPAMNDLLGGQVDFMCDQTTNTTNQIKSGKVKVYGVTSLKRVPSLADVPTLNEQGVKGFEVGIWHALYAPKGTPKPAIDKLVAALQDAVKDPTVNQRFADLGATAYPVDKATPAALSAHLKAEIDKWAPIIKKAGVYAD